MSDKKEECFIIMPITTPGPMIAEYRDGEEHFKHVLDCLFIPAIEQAGYRPVTPIAEGSDLIHAEIIKNLETAAIVLCDISCLNPNVFFEFGIRTSLNKPVCIVKDELTKNVPFDTGILNYKEYKSTLETWHITDEINIISDHLKVSAGKSDGQNTLWKYFGFKSEAEPYKVETGTEGKIDYLTMQIDQLIKKSDIQGVIPRTKKGLIDPDTLRSIKKSKVRYSKADLEVNIDKLWPYNCYKEHSQWFGNTFEITCGEGLGIEIYTKLMNVAASMGFTLRFKDTSYL